MNAKDIFEEVLSRADIPPAHRSAYRHRFEQAEIVRAEAMAQEMVSEWHEAGWDRLMDEIGRTG